MIQQLCVMVILAALTSGCLKDFPKESVVAERRILAAQTDPPELIIRSASDPIPPFTLTTLAVDPTSALPQPLTIWACAPTPTGRCDGADERIKVTEQSVVPGEIAATVQLTPQFMEIVLQKDKYFGFGGLDVQLHLVYGDVHASKLMVFGYPVPEGRIANQIPRIKAITFDGQSALGDTPLRFPVKTAIAVSPVPEENSQEDYTIVTFSGETRDQRERITYSWFTTAGTFEPEQSGGRKGILQTGETDVDPKTTFTTPETPGMLTLWSVIRDERGGSSWKRWTMIIE